jgi:hypothetical protein
MEDTLIRYTNLWPFPNSPCTPRRGGLMLVYRRRICGDLKPAILIAIASGTFLIDHAVAPHGGVSWNL